MIIEWSRVHPHLYKMAVYWLPSALNQVAKLANTLLEMATRQTVWGWGWCTNPQKHAGALGVAPGCVFAWEPIPKMPMFF